MHKEYASLRRRPLFAPVWLAALTAILFVGLAIWLFASASTTTIIVMRHAEKAALPAEDPPLSLAGEGRAQELAQVLGQAPAEFRIQAIFVSEFHRTQDTALPLANRIGVPVIVVPAKETEIVADRARSEYRGGRVLIVGHSNTVPAIVEQLSGQTIPPMADTEYGIVYVVSLPRFSRATVTRFDFP